MDDPNQDAYGGKIEIESTEVSEGDSGIETEEVTSEETTTPKPEPQDQVSEIFQEDDEKAAKIAAENRQKTRDGIVRKQLDLLINTDDEDKREEIFNKFPALREELEEEYNKYAQPEDDRITKLEKEIERLKEVNQKSESKKSKEELDNFIARSGFTQEEFNRQYGKIFLSSMRNHMSTGLNKSQALKSTIGDMVMTYGFVPRTPLEEAEERGRQSSGMVMPSISSRNVNPERSLQKELQEHNAELATMGISPISMEVYKEYKKSL